MKNLSKLKPRLSSGTRLEKQKRAPKPTKVYKPKVTRETNVYVWKTRSFCGFNRRPVPLTRGGGWIMAQTAIYEVPREKLIAPRLITAQPRLHNNWKTQPIHKSAKLRQIDSNA